MGDRYITIKVGRRNIRKLRVEHIQFIMNNQMAFWDRLRQKELDRLKKPSSTGLNTIEEGSLS
jgi:hypothetical protein